jgi:hypothetical protein
MGVTCRPVSRKSSSSRSRRPRPLPTPRSQFAHGLLVPACEAEEQVAVASPLLVGHGYRHFRLTAYRLRMSTGFRESRIVISNGAPAASTPPGAIAEKRPDEPWTIAPGDQSSQ